MSNTIESQRTHPRGIGKHIVIPSTAGEFPSIIFTDTDGDPFPHTVHRLLNPTATFKTNQERKQYKDDQVNTRIIQFPQPQFCQKNIKWGDIETRSGYT